MKRIFSNSIAAIALIAFTLLAFYNNDKNTISENKRTTITQHEAKAVAEGQVKTVLKAPSTAIFSGLLDTKYESLERGLRVKGYVDSQNSFGAMMRSKYSVEIYVSEYTGEILYRNLQLE